MYGSTKKQHFTEQFLDQFNQNSNGTQGVDLFKMVTELSQKFDGKSQNELLKAIYVEAERNKRNGTLTNDQIDTFVSLLSDHVIGGICQQTNSADTGN